jgi:hypothetical protein
MGVSSEYMLSDPASDRYLERMAAVIRAAHLSFQFTAAERLLGYLRALHSRTHGGLYTRLTVHPAAGLPVLSEWERVQADTELAESILVNLPTEEVVRERAEPERLPDQLIKWRYWSQLHALRLPPIESLRVELRKLDRDSGTVHVRVVLDKLGAAGLLVRYSIELSEAIRNAESQQLLTHTSVNVSATSGLRERLSQWEAMGAENIFIELALLPSVTVERVCKATVGPFCIGELPTGLPFGHLLASPQGAFATFGLDVAAKDIARDSSNDPLPHLLLNALSAEELAEYERARLRFGYRTYRDRKFVTDLATQPAVENLCHAAGTRNIIYVAGLDSSGIEASP